VDNFYRLYDQTNSVKALKEVRCKVFQIRLESHQHHSTMLR